jgi:hypothetical protein
MPPNSRVELYAAIRRDARAGVSGRELQRKHGVGWRTVQAAIASAWPQQRARGVWSEGERAPNRRAWIVIGRGSGAFIAWSRPLTRNRYRLARPSYSRRVNAASPRPESNSFWAASPASDPACDPKIRYRSITSRPRTASPAETPNSANRRRSPATTPDQPRPAKDLRGSPTLPQPPGQPGPATPPTPGAPSSGCARSLRVSAVLAGPRANERAVGHHHRRYAGEPMVAHRIPLR